MRSVFFMAAAAAALPIGAAQAFELDYVGARAGTLGLGAEVGVELLPLITGRLVLNKFDYSYNTDLDGIEYDGDLKLGSFGVQIDFQAPGTPFFASGGFFRNENEATLLATPTTNVTIGDVTYTPAQVGTLTTDFEFEDNAPYLGIGARFGVPKIEFVIEAGAYFQGNAEASLTASSPLAADPAFQAELEKERQALQEDLEDLEVYPVVNAGLRYRF